jgi:precorrin-6B C5,15-methyltransferase / cobalt-precorrin-6B C5,C15-methyltransferase
MGNPVTVIGIGAGGTERLSPRARAAIESSTFLAGGIRHLNLVGHSGAQTFTITNNIPELIRVLRERGPDERCVVLASGDPLCFGIGQALAEALGADQIVVEPAVSSLQLGFARAGVAWHEAALASIHGRPLESTLRPLLGRSTIGLLTQDGLSPAAVAAFFLAHGLHDYDAWVGESLGALDERVTALPLAELVGRRFGDLNVLILKRRGGSPNSFKRYMPGIPDAQFAQPETGPVLLTHADVRAVCLSRFRDLPLGPIWDIGAGLGGMSVELARSFPAHEVVAVEREQEQVRYLRINKEQFETYNLHIVAEEAPEALVAKASPAAVFLGGSGGRLDAILTLCLDRLVTGGCLVANFVGLENLSRCLERLREANWATQVTQVQLSQGQPLGGLTVLMPQLPVWVVRGSNTI